MNMKKTKRYAVLSILFFLPVAFLLMLYPSTHNYTPLEIVNNNVTDFYSQEDVKLQDHITVLAFFGKKPLENSIAASNLKELVYDKFKGFKKFQVVVVAPKGFEDDYKELKAEVERYEELKFWHYIYLSEVEIKAVFKSLLFEENLDENLSTDHVFVIDKERNQRGRTDDREEKEIEKNIPVYSLSSYDCIEVSEVKNKMIDDIRILFTEYRQKRKGKFVDSNNRRSKDLKNE